MKLKLFVIVIISMIAMSCAKEKTIEFKSYTDVPSELIGSWKWIYTSGGFGGVVYTPATTGETRKIDFGDNYILKYYSSGNLKSEIPFSIEKGVSALSHDSVFFLVNTLWSRQSIVFKSSDTLLLSDEFFDGYGNYYLRIN
jgi:hypothetical protein